MIRLLKPIWLQATVTVVFGSICCNNYINYIDVLKLETATCSVTCLLRFLFPSLRDKLQGKLYRVTPALIFLFLGFSENNNFTIFVIIRWRLISIRARLLKFSNNLLHLLFAHWHFSCTKAYYFVNFLSVLMKTTYLTIYQHETQVS